MAQTKVLKTREYWMYFPFSELRGWGKRPAIQPQTIYSEFPLPTSHTTVRTVRYTAVQSHKCRDS